MKTYIVYVDGVEREMIKAGNQQSAEKKARKYYGGKRMGKDMFGKNKLVEKDIHVVYTEV